MILPQRYRDIIDQFIKLRQQGTIHPYKYIALFKIRIRKRNCFEIGFIISILLKEISDIESDIVMTVSTTATIKIEYAKTACFDILLFIPEMRTYRESTAPTEIGSIA